MYFIVISSENFNDSAKLTRGSWFLNILYKNYIISIYIKKRFFFSWRSLQVSQRPSKYLHTRFSWNCPTFCPDSPAYSWEGILLRVLSYSYFLIFVPQKNFQIYPGMVHGIYILRFIKKSTFGLKQKYFWTVQHGSCLFLFFLNSFFTGETWCLWKKCCLFSKREIPPGSSHAEICMHITIFISFINWIISTPIRPWIFIC